MNETTRRGNTYEIQELEEHTNETVYRSCWHRVREKKMNENVGRINICRTLPHVYLFALTTIRNINIGLTLARIVLNFMIFIELSILADECVNILDQMHKQWFSKNEKLRMPTCKCCHICNNEFTKHDTVIQSHCVDTGTFLGPAHPICNII